MSEDIRDPLKKGMGTASRAPNPQELDGHVVGTVPRPASDYIEITDEDGDGFRIENGVFTASDVTQDLWSAPLGLMEATERPESGVVSFRVDGSGCGRHEVVIRRTATRKRILALAPPAKTLEEKVRDLAAEYKGLAHEASDGVARRALFASAEALEGLLS
jgi:hypothetical protein